MTKRKNPVKETVKETIEASRYNHKNLEKVKTSLLKVNDHLKKEYDELFETDDPVAIVLGHLELLKTIFLVKLGPIEKALLFENTVGWVTDYITQLSDYHKSVSKGQIH